MKRLSQALRGWSEFAGDKQIAGGEEVAVIEPGNPKLYAGETTTRREGGLLVAETEFLPADGNAYAIDRSQLRITVLGQNHAVDIQGCSAG